MNRNRNTLPSRGPLMSWDISNPIHTMGSSKAKELATLMKFSEENDWQTDLTKELSGGYQALVLTNLDQRILWVSEGFHTMTGYPLEAAIGKKPSFLQGPNTSEYSKIRIRKMLAIGSRFSESIINYRKNGEEYQCQISVIPLVDLSQTTTHFLALEKEII